jgi:hypothetical protein
MGVASSATSESILCSQCATRVPLRAPNCVPNPPKARAAGTAASVQREIARADAARKKKIFFFFFFAARAVRRGRGARAP